MSVSERYKLLLTMSQKALCCLIDRYNKGDLSDKTRLALEMLDAFCKEDIQ